MFFRNTKIIFRNITLKYIIRYTITRSVNLVIFFNNVNCTNTDFVLCARLRAARLLPLALLVEGDFMRSALR